MFEINRPDKDSGVGIYAQSVEVKPKEHKELATQLVDWFNEANGTFKGEFAKAFAIAHCQVANVEAPIKLFVVDKDLVEKNVPEDKKQNMVNCFFESQAIFNAQVLEAPQKVKKQVPKRKVTPVEGKKGQVEVEMVTEEKEISNIITVPEACMSWQHRKSRNTQRYHTIKVRYQYIDKNLVGMEVVKTFEGWVEGLKAHILQHECQHFDGKNMFYDETV